MMQRIANGSYRKITKVLSVILITIVVVTSGCARREAEQPITEEFSSEIAETLSEARADPAAQMSALELCRVSGQCGVGLDGSLCTEDAHCFTDESLYCDTVVFDGDAANVCEPLNQLGERCSEDRQCVDGLYCDNTIGDGDSGNLCEPLNTAGAPCITDNQCISGLYCDIVVADGNPANLCKSLNGMGGSCAADSQCGEGLYCDTLTEDGDAANICEPPNHEGNACFYEYQCADGLYCDLTIEDDNAQFICRSPAQAGAACFYDYQCTSRQCDRLSKVCR